MPIFGVSITGTPALSKLALIMLVYDVVMGISQTKGHLICGILGLMYQQRFAASNCYGLLIIHYFIILL